MRKKVNNYLDSLLKGYSSPNIADIKEEIAANLIERINDKLSEGANGNDAFDSAVSDIGSTEDLVINFQLVKSTKDYQKISIISLIVISILSYFTLGIIYGYWTIGLSVFFISGMIISTIKSKFGTMWLLSLTLYVLLGSLYLDYLTASVVIGFGIVLVATKDQYIAGLWLSLIIGYVFFSVMYSIWHPLWIIFVVGFAITALLAEKSVTAFAWLIGIAIFLFFGIQYQMWHPAWVVFLLAAAVTAYIESPTNE